MCLSLISATTASKAPDHSDCLRKRELVSAGVHAPMDGHRWTLRAAMRSHLIPTAEIHYQRIGA